MNENSVLCRYISNHPKWESTLETEFRLKIGRDGSYAIFNYGYEADFSDPIVQEARGIILDLDKLEVVCWPFRKFGNFSEDYADPIDWTTACVQEKIDGSIIKLWFSERRNRWVFSTNGNIDSANAPLGDTGNGHTFLDAIESAENYKDLHLDTLDRDLTYIFELVGPENRVVVSYRWPMLYHIGTRSNLTGEEFQMDIGIFQPKRYPLSSLEECVEAAMKLNDGQSTVNHEGFVVVDADWHRVKIKSPDYLVKHRIRSVYLNRENAVELILSDTMDTLRLCEIRPEDAAIIKYYDWQLEELFLEADHVAELARAMYEEYSHDRGAVARTLVKHPLSAVGFQALKDQADGRTILRRSPLSRICRYIKPYERQKLS